MGGKSLAGKFLNSTTGISWEDFLTNSIIEIQTTMKQIIDGKRYDTEKATEVASYSYGNLTDFHGIEETLYRTEKGTWFLHGWGGAATKYATDLGNGSSGDGEDIQPMTPVQAMRWLERFGKADELEEYFSDEIEDA